MILNINQLRAFHTAAKFGSITSAARELMVTPPAISMQIKQLEENLRIRLMFRDGNAIQLTDVGKMIFKKCNLVFKKIKDMENFLADISEAKSGLLKIGCPQTPAKFVMPRLIAEFKKAYPSVKIILDQGTSSEMIKSILEGTNELAVTRYRPDEKRIKIKLFGSEEVVLIAASDSKNLKTEEISVTQLSTIPLIVPQKGSATRDVTFEYLRRFKVNPIVVLESASVDLIKQLVRQDNGVSFLGRSAVHDDLKKGSLRPVRILEGSPIIEFGIGYIKRKSLSPAAWAFLRLLDRLNDIFPPVS